MLYKYSTPDGDYNFLDRKHGARKARNVFTIIVGKNGTGKSRLLRDIAIEYLGRHGDVKKFSGVPKIREGAFAGIAHSTLSASKLICVSTSPFDKFPLIKRNFVPYYSYLGLRGLTTNNMGLAYIARIIYTLADAASQSSAHSRSIGDVLEYLNYEPVMNVTFGHSSHIFLSRLMSSDRPRDEIDEFTSRPGMFSADYLAQMRELLGADDRTFRRFMKAAARLAEWPKRTLIEMRLISSGVEMARNSALSPEDVVSLGRFGMLRLKDVGLHKKGSDTPLMISEMSSGEQSVIMGLLGIGSQLKDGALVCIDEPETCLHPEWQERYIQLLSQIFTHYENCQFIVATHSPQMVAQLPNDGCYVMSMEDGIAHHAKEFSKRSIDFQLATVFKAPGFKNEYLSRIALNIFVEVAKARAFSVENLENLRTLERAIPDLRRDDPLLEIIESVREMFKAYGGH